MKNLFSGPPKVVIARRRSFIFLGIADVAISSFFDWGVNYEITTSSFIMQIL